MPAPAYSVLADTRWGKRQVVKFGGLPVPIIGGAASFIDLMDGVNWFNDPRQSGIEVKVDRHLVTAPYVWRAKSQWQGEDYYPVNVSIPILYDESNGNSFQIARAQLFQLGAQMLTFDNATGLIAVLQDIAGMKMRVTALPYLWEGQLKFVGYEPWWKDFTSSTQIATNLAGSTGAGSNTAFTITYIGNVWTEPSFLLHIPATNTVRITKFVLTGQEPTTDEVLTISFPGTGLAANTLFDITIDCGLFTVTDQNGKQYDFSGSFPLLYPPPGTVLDFNTNLVTGSGTSTGVTLQPTWTNRWMP